MQSPTRRLSTQDTSHGVDLAPMLDFVVNLLIFFIVTAVFVKEAGIEMSRPQSSSDGAKSSKTIVIADDGEISIDGDAVDLRAVRAHIERFRATEQGGIVILAHEHAPTGVVVAVADQTHLGGIQDITFSTAE